MVWQDIVLTIALIGLSYAVIPQIIKIHREKKSLISIQMSIITIICVMAITIVYINLGFIFSAIINIISIILWEIVLIQSIIYKK